MAQGPRLGLDHVIVRGISYYVELAVLATGGSVTKPPSTVS